MKASLGYYTATVDETELLVMVGIKGPGRSLKYDGGAGLPDVQRGPTAQLALGQEMSGSPPSCERGSAAESSPRPRTTRAIKMAGVSVAKSR